MRFTWKAEREERQENQFKWQRNKMIETVQKRKNVAYLLAHSARSFIRCVPIWAPSNQVDSIPLTVPAPAVAPVSQAILFRLEMLVPRPRAERIDRCN